MSRHFKHPDTSSLFFGSLRDAARPVSRLQTQDDRERKRKQQSGVISFRFCSSGGQIALDTNVKEDVRSSADGTGPAAEHERSLSLSPDGAEGEEAAGFALRYISLTLV